MRKVLGLAGLVLLVSPLAMSDNLIDPVYAVQVNVVLPDGTPGPAGLNLDLSLTDGSGSAVGTRSITTGTNGSALANFGSGISGATAAHVQFAGTSIFQIASVDAPISFSSTYLVTVRLPLTYRPVASVTPPSQPSSIGSYQPPEGFQSPSVTFSPPSGLMPPPPSYEPIPAPSGM